ncbi:MAG: N-acetylglucosamine-6-phosphate deacetylase [Armatimonadota bacterium]|nr:N-acetylglucosamine-6-phosphate deacetylase [Armatimonadota bacterium]MDR7464347.1 N-acetylglucosamine-6-phosphate deacetylase [Armatimonadota bacterium]MDR7537939.1 N-acetylglucosamine-6-phosphate deacetylase [Armatimonadota bacterium]
MEDGVLAVVGGRVLTPFREIPRGTVLIRGERIEAVGAADEVIVPAQAARLDASGSVVAPGFVDIHVHGGAGADFMDATLDAVDTACGFHARGGTTALLATLRTAPLEDIVRALEVLREAVGQRRQGAAIAGVHIECPYFAPAEAGAQPPEAIKDPAPEEWRRLLAFAGLVRRVSAAPELPRALELGRELVANGIVASIGHTAATFDDVVRAVEAGYSHVTHMYSSMSGLRRVQAFRIPGVIEATLLLDDLSTEMIADGCHLPSALIRLIIKAKGVERLCVCTDAVRVAGFPPGEYTSAGRPVLVEDGVAKLPDRSVFAGSTATMDRCLRTLVTAAGVSLQDAVKMATINPARFMRLDGDRGSLARGKRADLVILDDALTVRLTVVGGKIVYDGRGDGAHAATVLERGPG